MKTNRKNSRSTDETDSAKVEACRRKFLRFFPKGFADAKYFDWERVYKWKAHEKWREKLNKAEFAALLKKGEFLEIADRAVKIESPTNLLFSFEKITLRDAVKTAEGARIFAEGLFAFLHGAGKPEKKFENWREAVESLPKKQSRVLTHPIVTCSGLQTLIVRAHNHPPFLAHFICNYNFLLNTSKNEVTVGVSSLSTIKRVCRI